MLWMIHYTVSGSTTSWFKRASAHQSSVPVRMEKEGLMAMRAKKKKEEVSEEFFEEENLEAVSYTHLRAHETKANLVCRLLLEKKKIYA